MEAKALAKSLRISPRKAGIVASLIRGRTVSDALVILEHTPRKAAPMLAKVVNSAAANARQKHNARPEELVIEKLDIGAGPSMKRYFTAAHGRARPYKKRTTHVSILLKGSSPVKSERAKKTEVKDAKTDTAKTRTAKKPKKTEEKKESK